ncbi:hypothetical protein C8J56DRAFT_151383 [Mycena floridula]|nr:hypothetical protein C8J56DRAFT_151383 [Mycena floridula]
MTHPKLVMFVSEFVAHLAKETPVSVMNVNPGFCHSKLTRESESKFPGKLLVGAFKLVVARFAEAGSRTIVHAVVTRDEKKLHGNISLRVTKKATIFRRLMVSNLDNRLGKRPSRFWPRLIHELVKSLKSTTG